MMALIMPLMMSFSSLAYETSDEFNRVSTSLYGKSGIVDMPNALFFETGHLAITGMLKSPDDRVTLDFQPLPWLETSFRYSIVTDFFPNLPRTPDLFDRSFDFKVRLTKQHPYWPAVAVGIQDIGGTGIYGSEFIVATYQTEHFNFTGGVGFGRFASRGNLTNPLALAFDEAKTRSKFTGLGETGQVNSAAYFRGEDMGLFGGIEYLTPIKGLKLAVEYSSDSYEIERKRGIADGSFPVNFGVSYRIAENVELGAALIQGDVFAARLTIQTNPNTQTPLPDLDEPRFQFRVRDPDALNKVDAQIEQNEMYKRYAQQVRQTASDDQSTQKDFLSPDHVWKPWESASKTKVSKRWANQTFDGSQPTSSKPSKAKESLPTDPGSQLAAAIFQSRFTPPAIEGSPEKVGEQNQQAGPPANADLDIQDLIEEEKSRLSVWPLSQEQEAKTARRIERAAKLQSLFIIGVEFQDRMVEVYYHNSKYHLESEAIGRLLAVLSQVAPDGFEHFKLVAVDHDMQVNQIIVPRRPLERLIANHGSPEELYNTSIIGPGPLKRKKDLLLSQDRYPNIGYSLSPSFRYSLFDPDDPMRYQLGALANGFIEPIKGLTLAGTVRLGIYDNFDEITRGPGSQLPHVRTDFARYLNETTHGIENLSLSYFWQPAKNVYARTYAGYLEEMYAGFGGEVMYRPYGKKWAASLELDYVQKRAFDRRLDLLDYKVMTGFAKFYYQTDYQDLKFELNVGRYLAKDLGATLRVSKTFDNGTEIGAFATLTDVPFDVFGEGSFDKGLIIKIPFHTFSFFDTKRLYAVSISLLTRDGGAQVWSGTPLYDITAPYSHQQLVRTWDGVLE
jgi:Exopolysaccharide biosynthesis protein YbjH